MSCFYSPESLNALYVIGLFSSGATFLYLRTIWSRFVPEVFFWIHFFIVSWSAMMYLHLVYMTPLASFAYYADWIVSTPLIMLALGLTAMYPLEKIEWTPLFAIMMIQCMVILTGLFAQISGSLGGLHVFFFLGNALMFLMFYMLFGPLMAIARTNSMLFPKYKTLVYLLVGFWLSYPLVWILGSKGYGIFSPYVTNILFIVLPVLCKPVFGFIDLYLLRTVHDN